jgi:RecB family exonuclease
VGRQGDPLILLVPSLAAAIELPRRLASARGALAGVYAVRPLDLARAIAEPALLGRGLGSWDSGRDVLLASHLLAGDHGLPIDPELPRSPIARVLARTLAALRLAAVSPERLEVLASRASIALDGRRLRALGALYRRFTEALEGRFADTAAILREARERLEETAWLKNAEVLLVEPLELDPPGQDFVAALARAVPVRLLDVVAARAPDSFGAWARSAGIGSIAWTATPLAPIAPPLPPPALDRLRTRLFSPPEGAPVRDGSVELLTAPGEAAEARSIARRLLREAARGVSFEDMGVILPRPDEYATLFTDLFERLDIPFRLHPSLPLRTGRAARSLLLLLRCRGLSRAAVMEFLGFAPVPYGNILGDGASPTVASWEDASRNAGVTEGIERWRVGLGSYVRMKRREAEVETIEARRTGAARRADDASALGRVVEALAVTLEELSGEASWPEWSRRLMQAFDRWVGPERDREAVSQVIADAASLGPMEAGASWEDVESVLEARLEWERLPMDAPARGGVHVGALDAIAGLPFRVVAIPGLVEGGYPAPIRPDPFLLDAEREALGAPSGWQPSSSPASSKRQLSLFEDNPAPSPSRHVLPTTQDRLVEARRLFERAVGQAAERLILSYPRADPRSGRERLPSLFFVSAASVLEGRPLDMSALAPRLVEDDTRRLDPADAVDGSERDRARLVRGGSDAALAIASGAPFFKGSILSSAARWKPQLTAYDGLVDPPRDAHRTFDPVASGKPLSATRLRTYADCGFRYLLESVLRLEPVEEPEDRMGLEPMERGLVFHEVAERFLRERRQRGELPVRDTPALGARLVEIAEEALAHLVEASPPRHRLLWDMERARLHDLLAKWLTREAVSPRGTPTYFEVSFGVRRDLDTDEPHSTEPLDIDLGDGRTLRVSGKIDRIDTKPDGSLVVRDYKTGRAPKDEGGLFRGGRQFQIPFYVKAASMLLPGRRVSEAFLDYVDGGRLVSFDPARATGDDFVALLRELVDAIARGLFVQDAAACRFCDFTRVCGPQPLIAARQERKRRDPRVARLLRLKEAP